MDSPWSNQTSGPLNGDYNHNNMTRNMVDLVLRLGLPDNDHNKNDQPQFGQYVSNNLMAPQPMNLNLNISDTQGNNHYGMTNVGENDGINQHDMVISGADVGINHYGIVNGGGNIDMSYYATLSGGGNRYGGQNNFNTNQVARSPSQPNFNVNQVIAWSPEEIGENHPRYMNHPNSGMSGEYPFSLAPSSQENFNAAKQVIWSPEMVNHPNYMNPNCVRSLDPNIDLTIDSMVRAVPLTYHNAYNSFNNPSIPTTPSMNNNYMHLDNSLRSNIDVEIGSSSHSSKKSRRRQSDIRYNDPNKRCTNYNCNTNDTPMWRKGPHGPKTLCNACGIKYRKEQNKRRLKDANA